MRQVGQWKGIPIMEIEPADLPPDLDVPMEFMFVLQGKAEECGGSAIIRPTAGRQSRCTERPSLSSLTCDEPMFPPPKVDYDQSERGLNYGCLFALGCVVVFWAVLLATMWWALK